MSMVQWGCNCIHFKLVLGYKSSLWIAFSTGFSWQPCITTTMEVERLHEHMTARFNMEFVTQGSAKEAGSSALSRRSHRTVSCFSFLLLYNLLLLSPWMGSKHLFSFFSLCICPYGVSDWGLLQVTKESTRELSWLVLLCTCPPFHILPDDQQGWGCWLVSCTTHTF